MGFPGPSFKVNIMHNVNKLVKLCQPTRLDFKTKKNWTSSTIWEIECLPQTQLLESYIFVMLNFDILTLII